MRLLPDQVPHLPRFLVEHQAAIRLLFFHHAQLEPMTPDDQRLSTEPCWLWTGPLEAEDHEPLPGLYYETSGTEASLVRGERVPFIDLRSTLTPDEANEWTPGQKQYLLVPARAIAWLLRHDGLWTVDGHELHTCFLSPCTLTECVQPWHLVRLDPRERNAAEQYQLKRDEVIRQFRSKKRCYEDSLALTRRHAPTELHKAGPHLVAGSLEHTRRSNWLALYDTKLQRVLGELERSYDPDYDPIPRPVPAFQLNGEEQVRLEAFMAQHLDRSGDCWLVRSDSRYASRGKLRFNVRGRVLILRRLLFSQHFHQAIPEGSTIQNTCHTSGCHRPTHQIMTPGS